MKFLRFYTTVEPTTLAPVSVAVFDDTYDPEYNPNRKEVEFFLVGDNTDVEDNLLYRMLKYAQVDLVGTKNRHTRVGEIWFNQFYESGKFEELKKFHENQTIVFLGEDE